MTVKSRLHREMNAFMDTGTRNAAPIGSDEPLSAWAITRIGVRVAKDEAALVEFIDKNDKNAETKRWDAVLCGQNRCETE